MIQPLITPPTNRSTSEQWVPTFCQFYNALKFRQETPALCCAGGKVKLPELLKPPEPLNLLLSGQDPHLKHFLQNYNNVFQVTSLGAKVIQQQGFNPTFKVSNLSWASMAAFIFQLIRYHKT